MPVNPCPSAAAWREAGHADLAGIDAIARLVHPALPERPEVFAEKLRLFTRGCLVLAAGPAVMGYALSHPWALHAVPALDRFLHALPEGPGCLFLHDVALKPEARGLGAGAALVARLEAVALDERLDVLSLVAVHGTPPFWERLGFRRVENPELSRTVAGYGPAAAYMACPLPRG